MSDRMQVAIMNSVSRAIGEAKILASPYNGLAEMTLMWKDVSESASKYGRSIGMSAYAISNTRHNLSKIAEIIDIGGKYGVTTNKLFEIQKSFDDTLSRAVSFDAVSVLHASRLSAIFDNNTEALTKYITSFQDLGVSIKTSETFATNMYKQAGAAGISFEKLTKNLVENFKLVKKYNFKEGIEGLETMVKKSMELSFNIKQTENFAKSIWDGGFSKATEYAAKLQVLGGTFAQIGDPISLMYNSFYDLNSLQDSLASMAKDKAFFNEKTGQMDMGAFDKQLLYQASKGTGIDYDELLNTAYRQGIRDKIDSELNHTTVDKSLREMLMNIGEIRKNKDGTIEVGAVIGNKWHTAEEISNSSELMDKLVIQGKSNEDNIGDIAHDTSGILTAVKRIEAGYSNKINRKIDETYGSGMLNNFIASKLGQHGDRMMEDWYEVYIGQAMAEHVYDYLGAILNESYNEGRDNYNSPLRALTSIGGETLTDPSVLLGGTTINGTTFPGLSFNFGGLNAPIGIGTSGLMVKLPKYQSSTLDNGQVSARFRDGGTIGSYNGGGTPSTYGISDNVSSRSNEGLLSTINSMFHVNDEGIPGKVIIANTGETIMSEPATRSFYNTLQSMNDNPLNQTDIFKSLLYDLSYGGNIAYNQPVMEVSSNYNGNVVTPHYSNSYNSDNSVSIKPIDFNINVSGNFDMKMPDGSTMNNLLDIRLLSELLFKTPEFRDYIMRITNEELVYKIKGLMTTNTLLS